MPKTVSQAQNRLMHMCAHRSMDGCPPPHVVEGFNASVHGTHKVRHMPQHVREGQAVRGPLANKYRTKLKAEGLDT